MLKSFHNFIPFENKENIKNLGLNRNKNILCLNKSSFISYRYRWYVRNIYLSKFLPRQILSSLEMIALRYPQNNILKFAAYQITDIYFLSNKTDILYSNTFQLLILFETLPKYVLCFKNIRHKI